MTIETARLCLRPWQEDDAAALYKYASDPRVGPPAGWVPHVSVEDSLRVIREILAVEGTFAVTLRGSDEPVGSIGIFPATHGEHRSGRDEYELGYWIAVPLWGQGLIPEAAHALISRFFSETGADHLWCAYYDGNEKSRRVQEKCGFLPHHTEYERKCPSVPEARTEHFTLLTKENWLKKNGS